MKIVVDEHIPLMTVKVLRELGHEVRDIRGTSLEGMQDDDLWMFAQRHGCMLITADRGFTRYRLSEHQGILIVLLRQPNRHKIHQRIMQGLSQFPEVDWPGLFVVMRDRAQSIWKKNAHS